MADLKTRKKNVSRITTAITTRKKIDPSKNDLCDSTDLPSPQLIRTQYQASDFFLVHLSTDSYA